MDDAFSFVIHNKGIDTEGDYKYTGSFELCNVKKEKHRNVSIDSYQDVPPKDESSLQKANTCSSVPQILLSLCTDDML